MSKSKFLCVAAVAVCLSYTSSAFGAFGLGLHYSLDFSTKMDAANEQLTFDSLNLVTTGFAGSLPSTWTSSMTISPQNIPIYFDRGELTRTPFGLGGKIYIDIIPFIDCIELGGDFAAFEYDGKIKFPTGIAILQNTTLTPDEVLSGQNPSLVSITYGSISTNIDSIEGAPALPGISKTPFVKLDINLTIRKYIPVPVIDKVIRPYGGLGFDVMFATPVPSAGLINDAIGEDLIGNKTLTEVVAVMQDTETPNKIITEIVDRLMTPHFGMNIVVGLMIKPPVIPIGIYVDGKYMIPFGKLDDDANVTAMGFKLNAGLCLHFGKSK